MQVAVYNGIKNVGKNCLRNTPKSSEYIILHEYGILAHLLMGENFITNLDHTNNIYCLMIYVSFNRNRSLNLGYINLSQLDFGNG